MKRFNFILLIMFVAGLSFAQTKVVMERASETGLMEGSYVIDARPLLEKFEKANHIDLGTLPQAKPSLKKVAWNFTVGSTYTWWASDLRTGASPAFYQVVSTCRAVGTNAYIFVQDSLWNSRVNQSAVDSVRIAFDSKTPSGSINPNQGIYQNDVNTFGTPPNVDGDSKIIILILDIRDGYKGTGGYTAGYFYGYNEYTPAQGAPYSNVAEIYYLDANPADLMNSSGLQKGMATTAHEFQHMIHFNYNPNQQTFVNESMSMCAEVVNGYPMRSQDTFNNETNHYLFDWRGSDNTKVLTDYARAARYSVYLYEQFGVDILKKIVQAPSIGINGLTYAFQNVVPTTSRRFSDELEDWFIANILNDKTVNSRYGYTNVAAANAVAKVHVNPNVTNYADSVYQYGAQYITYSSGSNLKINFNLNSAFIKVKAIKFGNGAPVIENLISGQDYSVPDFGSAYNKVTFMVYVTDQSAVVGPYKFSYTSTGTFQKQTIELAYDSTEPVGYVSQTAGDSLAVQFDAVSGGKLDSIRVAIRNLVPIDGKILEYVGYSNRLGGKNYANITAVSKLTTAPSVIDPTGTYPYPQPYPNWATIDVRSSNISTDKSFVVEFPFLGTSTSVNKVLSTYMPSTGTEHTIFYSASSNKWVYYGVSGHTNYSWAALIRAYVTVGGTTGVNQVVELTPTSYSLAQNYPNPFNPSTNISYQLPTSSHVTLKVYDILGKEVETLVDEFQTAGTHNSQFSIMNSQLSSGVYFYTINVSSTSASSGQSFVQTRKMILIK
ncbi:MAG: T9SS type A sorting domain-containing protein [Bacteroidetes bacterium]|nr:T9SS type A sorting domain-containing protein [Bacteroidota bacterium]